MLPRSDNLLCLDNVVVIHDSLTVDRKADTFECSSFGAADEFKIIAGSYAAVMHP